MINSFLQLFSKTETLPDTGHDGRSALAALLVRLARADGDYAPHEREMIDASLSARFGLSAIDAAILRREGEALEAEAGDTVVLTRALKAAFPLEERLALLEDLWRVVLSDGKRDAHEDQLMRLSAHLLGITDQDSAFARQRAVQR